jgi:arylformamidase
MLLDVSQPVTPRSSHFPGDQPFTCGWTQDKPELHLGWVKTSPHVGTHVDAPFHFGGGPQRVGDLPLDAFVGPCAVVDAVGEKELHADVLRGVDLAGAPRVLFRTQRASDLERFHRDFPVLTKDAVEALARARVRLVGIDAPSMDHPDSKDLPIHHALARAGIVNVENLWLDRAEAGAYELLAAPVRWTEMEAAPLRALLRR